MARSSVYSRALSLPDWVLGGEYGDIAKTLNSREQSYEQLQAQEQVNDQRQIALDKAEEQAAFEDALSERFGENRPTSMRDAYEQMIDLAYETGNPLDAIAYESDLNKQKRSELSDAINLSPKLSYEKINELYPDLISESDYNLSRAKRGGSGAPRERFVRAINPKNGFETEIPWSKAEEAQKLGWILDPSTDMREQILQEVGQDAPPEKGPAKPDFRLFAPPANSAGVQDNRGDRARTGPSVGDQVDTIKRKRKVN